MKFTILKQEFPIFLIGAVSGVVAYFFYYHAEDAWYLEGVLLTTGAIFGSFVFGLWLWRRAGIRGLWWVPVSAVSFFLAYFSGSFSYGSTLIKHNVFFTFGLAGLVGALVLLLAGYFIVGKVSVKYYVGVTAIAFAMPAALTLVVDVGTWHTTIPSEQYLLTIMILWQACALVAIDLLLKHGIRADMSVLKREAPVFVFGAIAGFTASLLFPMFDFLGVPGVLLGILIFRMCLWRGFGIRGLWWVPASWLSFMVGGYIASVIFNGFVSVIDYGAVTFLSFGLGGFLSTLVLLSAGRILVGTVPLSGIVWVLTIAFFLPALIALLFDASTWDLLGQEPIWLIWNTLWYACALVATDLLLKHHDHQH